jgi:hypothetical protein
MLPPPGIVVDDNNKDVHGYQLCVVVPSIAAIAV